MAKSCNLPHAIRIGVLWDLGFVRAKAVSFLLSDYVMQIPKSNLNGWKKLLYMNLDTTWACHTAKTKNA